MQTATKLSWNFIFQYFKVGSLSQFHMGREHASREKKFTMVNFLIFVQKMYLELDSKRSKSAHERVLRKCVFCVFTL